MNNISGAEAKSQSNPAEPKHKPPSLVGSSEQMKQVRERIRTLADEAYPVLLTGETGTGKEIASQQLHHYSHPDKDSFYPINCAALSTSLMESELFGHREGSFTGADKQRTGLFEVASEGTLFLDEISETPQTFQSKLLRAVDNKEVKPVGANTTVEVSPRIIFASNKNLKEKVDSGEFREDLYYRISVFQIEMPPLRERRSDIPDLVSHFLKQNNKPDHTMEQISDRAWSLLMQHDWPGNVRELENTIRQSSVLAGNADIQPEHLPHTINHDRDTDGDMRSLKECVRDFEQGLIQALLKKGRDVDDICEELEISRSSFFRKR